MHTPVPSGSCIGPDTKLILGLTVGGRDRYTYPDVTLSPHPLLHPIFETLGYLLAYAMFRRSCTRHGNMLEDDQRWLIIATAAIGALVGSRMLGLMEQVFRLHITWGTFLLPGGRTTVGGLLGRLDCPGSDQALT